MGTATNWGTSSALNPEEDFEEPQDTSDIASFEREVGGKSGTTRRAPPTSGIDLGKGLDLEKPRAPRSGIGIEIGDSPQGNLGVGVEVPIGLSPFGARAGIAIDPRTGQIRGASGGLGVGKGPISTSVDVGVDTPSGSDKPGCYKYVTFTAGPFSHTYGQNDCEPKRPTPKSPTPGTDPTIPGDDESKWPTLDPRCQYLLWVYLYGRETIWENCKGWQYFDGGQGYAFESVYPGDIGDSFGTPYWNRTTGAYNYNHIGKPILGYVKAARDGVSQFVVSGDFNPDGLINGFNGTMEVGATITSASNWNVRGKFIYGSSGTRAIKETLVDWGFGWAKVSFILFPVCPNDFTDKPTPITNPDYNNPQVSLPSILPIANLPPTKRKMDDNCCKILTLYAQEILRLMGRPLGPQGQLIPIPPKGFFGEEKERTETPLSPENLDKKIKIKFTNYYELGQYFLDQLIVDDVASDPRSFKRPTGKLQNPDYNRDSETSLTSNNQPDKDKGGNKREFELGKDVYIQSSLQRQQYIFEALRRLEYLFPSGELDDAKIAKSLLIPGAKGDVKIHNMIQFQELFVQYINATLGDPRQILTIKDANPALPGDQPIEVSALTLADWARQIVKYQVDTAGDVDAAVNLILRDFRTNMANRTDIVKIGEIAQALFEDTGMREQQDYIPLHLEGDPYAGQWIKGQGFKANPDLEKKTEEATEKVLQETMNPTNIKVKVSRRHKEEKTDMRDLLRGLADFVQRLLSIPTGGDAAKSIEKLIESAKFKIQTDAALLRQNISQAATASRNRTRKKKKP